MIPIMTKQYDQFTLAEIEDDIFTAINNSEFVPDGEFTGKIVVRVDFQPSVNDLTLFT